MRQEIQRKTHKAVELVQETNFTKILHGEKFEIFRHFSPSLYWIYFTCVGVCTLTCAHKTDKSVCASKRERTYSLQSLKLGDIRY